jgi:hypothetical protein
MIPPLKGTTLFSVASALEHVILGVEFFGFIF